MGGKRLGEQTKSTALKTRQLTNVKAKGKNSLTAELLWGSFLAERAESVELGVLYWIRGGVCVMLAGPRSS